MVTDYFQNLEEQPAAVTAMEPIEVPPPQIKIIEANNTYGMFSIEPLERGMGATIGNPLRRILLSSLKGAAITWVKIDGILHEYSTIPHAKEDVVELLLNVKNIRLKSLSDRPGKLRLEVSGGQTVTAGDIMATSDFEIVNPELHLLTLDSDEAKVSIEFNVESGKGYVPAETAKGLPIGVLPVDAIYTPTRKVNFNVERTRVGQITDFERLVLEVWTDGTVTPVDAVVQASNILVEHFFRIANLGKVTEEAKDKASLALQIPVEHYNTPIERLELSSRTLNCLKRANINKVGQVLEMERAELLKIRNFGEKSATELYSRLEEMGFLPESLKSKIFGESEPAAQTQNDNKDENSEENS